MNSSIMNVYGSLQAELERAKEDLKGVEENIKKIIGRDPNEGPPNRLNLKRTISTVENSDDFEPEIGMIWRTNHSDGDFMGKGRKVTISKNWQDIDTRYNKKLKEEGSSVKRRLGETKTVFSRLSGPPRSGKKENDGDSTFLSIKPVLPSQVIVTPREVPSRKDVLAAQGNDESSRARNRRMFGALIGTLQKFRQEETRLKDREQKKAQVEKKLEEQAMREKEELKRERQELFQNRKRRQADIRNIELKMIRIQEQEEWEASNKHLKNFIQTKAKPHLFYLPKKHNKQTEERLAASQTSIEKLIEKKRAEVQEEVAAILRRNKNKSEAETEKTNDVDMNEESVDKENQVIASDLSSVKIEQIKDDTQTLDDKSSPTGKEDVVSDGQVVKTENDDVIKDPLS